MVTDDCVAVWPPASSVRAEQVAAAEAAGAGSTVGLDSLTPVD